MHNTSAILETVAEDCKRNPVLPTVDEGSGVTVTVVPAVTFLQFAPDADGL